jgi:hypothetical protein
MGPLGDTVQADPLPICIPASWLISFQPIDLKHANLMNRQRNDWLIFPWCNNATIQETPMYPTPNPIQGIWSCFWQESPPPLFPLFFPYSELVNHFKMPDSSPKGCDVWRTKKPTPLGLNRHSLSGRPHMPLLAVHSIKSRITEPIYQDILWKSMSKDFLKSNPSISSVLFSP